MISWIRSIFTMIVSAFVTTFFDTIVIVGAMLGAMHRVGGLFDRVPRIWSGFILRAAGVKVYIHGLDRLREIVGSVDGPFIFASNHLSNFDIPTLSVVLPKHYFIAKSELFKVPVFGPAIKAIGT